MNPLRAIHGRLIRIPLWRRYQRRLSRSLKYAVGAPDAYGDLVAIARRHNISAVLDIGSYTGDTIVRFIDELSVPVYGFEPTLDTFRKLEARFGGNQQVHLFQCALSDRDGEEILYCNENPQTNSLLDNDKGNIVSFPDETKHLDMIRVKVQRLDTWVSHNLPSGHLIIKADVQGAEGRLLDGGEATIRDRVLAIYAEAQLSPMYKGQTTFFELHERLTKEYGFYLQDIYPCLHDKTGKAVQTDALWINEKLVREQG